MDKNGEDVPLYDKNGAKIPRQEADTDYEHPCGVLIDLTEIRTLFKRNVPSSHFDDDLGNEPAGADKIEVYPLGFLRVAGNVQANGAPHCFNVPMRKVNQSIRRDANLSASTSEDSPATEMNEGGKGVTPVVWATSCQLYNYIAHRIAPRAGRLDSQLGMVTAALSGAFAQSKSHKATAKRKQEECDVALPSERFGLKIGTDKCPTCCRAEIVYSMDLSNLGSMPGRNVFLLQYDSTATDTLAVRYTTKLFCRLQIFGKKAR